ncbi:hypothetical protein AG1IA_04233 [Rhizoctonia solani AG-1 IA]|uniref:Uncharacterized protein n=1 Tax=Thanatephorus cucumeris (strain AG1-IA) TaxID=983506 RepID=L8WUB6_THACA|nr:hypothetical protein AG1IA_04233 [Rhizoctonia solani AG-1 IA]
MVVYSGKESSAALITSTFFFPSVSPCPELLSFSVSSPPSMEALPGIAVERASSDASPPPFPAVTGKSVKMDNGVMGLTCALRGDSGRGTCSGFGSLSRRLSPIPVVDLSSESDSDSDSDSEFSRSM